MNDALKEPGEEKAPGAGEVQVMKPIMRNGPELIGHYRDLTVEVRALQVAPEAGVAPPTLLTGFLTTPQLDLGPSCNSRT
jgi:hypothetical protein